MSLYKLIVDDQVLHRLWYLLTLVSWFLYGRQCYWHTTDDGIHLSWMYISYYVVKPAAFTRQTYGKRHMLGGSVTSPETSCGLLTYWSEIITLLYFV